MRNILEDIAKTKDETKDHPMNVGYLEVRPILKNFMQKLQENTVVHKEEEWAGQIKENWPYLVKYGSLAGLQGSGQDKTAIIVGASPALRKNVARSRLLPLRQSLLPGQVLLSRPLSSLLSQ